MSSKLDKLHPKMRENMEKLKRGEPLHKEAKKPVKTPVKKSGRK